MSEPRFTDWQRQYISDWFAGLHPSYRKELEIEHGGALTARQAWLLTFGEGAKPTPEKTPISTRTSLCHRLSSSPAQQSQGGVSLAAASEAVQGEAPMTFDDYELMAFERRGCAHYRASCAPLHVPFGGCINQVCPSFKAEVLA